MRAASALLLTAALLATAATVAAAGDDPYPPRTALHYLGPRGDDAAGHRWLSSAGRIELVASDFHSGVAATWYQVDGGGTQAYDAPFAPPAPTGAHTLTYWSEDAAGNVEAPKTATIRVDATPPEVAIVSPREGAVVAWDRPVMGPWGAVEARLSQAAPWAPIPWDAAPGGGHGAAPPVVRPANGGDAVVIVGATVRANASDGGVGLDRVEFYVDGELRRTDYQAPYEYYWSAWQYESGDHAVTARAVDRVQHAAEHTRTFTAWPAADPLLPFAPATP